jgi:4-diphosphocytidyl-2-C-methyl-D-erythritol kinase
MSTTVAAHAKLTVSLRITGIRSDGYHLIDAEMVSLDLADRLIIDSAWREDDGSELTASGPFSSGVPLDHTNLVAKALRMCNRHACVHIEKNIPHGGGLGGGSADAAAILRWADFNDRIEAATLGADVPFCMVGGRAQVQGIGELVAPLPYVAREFTLIIPPLQCPTPLVYRAWDDLGGPRSAGPNDLEPAAIQVEPRLIWWRDRISEAAGIMPSLAGSGSTWFVDGHRPQLVEALPDARVVLAATVA